MIIGVIIGLLLWAVFGFFAAMLIPTPKTPFQGMSLCIVCGPIMWVFLIVATIQYLLRNRIGIFKYGDDN